MKYAASSLEEKLSNQPIAQVILREISYYENSVGMFTNAHRVSVLLQAPCLLRCIRFCAPVHLLQKGCHQVTSGCLTSSALQFLFISILHLCKESKLLCSIPSLWSRDIDAEIPGIPTLASVAMDYINFGITKLCILKR